ncbi:unnamed protein product [Adineta steineri]|uniref:Uncharacterized protein n=1 Tax=Adineta steineri TaxID=433720 RepID=A0A814FUY3_9BILA|nr:unnamed protein product [Adineta steineri]
MNLPETLLSSLSIKSDNNEPSIPLLPTPTPLPSNMGVIHDKPITDLALKTPISFLQEICFRIHATPTYSLCPSEAQCTSSEPTFLYRVLVDDMIAFGKGSSKKRAKHKAAWVMIEQCYAKLKLASDPLIKTIEQYFLLKPLQTSHTNDDSITNGEKSNPIGKLQELTQKNWIRPPEYEFSDQENVSTPNTKMYSCHAKVLAYQRKFPSVRLHTKWTLMKALYADTQFLAKHGIVDYSLLTLCYNYEKQSIIYAGIIDYIRTYTWDKKLETIVKSIHGVGQSPTVISPEHYRTRFLRRMDQYFPVVPDEWHGYEKKFLDLSLFQTETMSANLYTNELPTQ